MNFLIASKDFWSIFSQLRENWLYKHLFNSLYIGFAFHLFPDFHTEELMNILLRHCKGCSVLYLYFALWNMPFSLYCFVLVWVYKAGTRLQPRLALLHCLDPSESLEFAKWAFSLAQFIKYLKVFWNAYFYIEEQKK